MPADGQPIDNGRKAGYIARAQFYLSLEAPVSAGAFSFTPLTKPIKGLMSSTSAQVADLTAGIDRLTSGKDRRLDLGRKAKTAKFNGRPQKPSFKPFPERLRCAEAFSLTLSKPQKRF